MSKYIQIIKAIPVSYWVVILIALLVRMYIVFFFSATWYSVDSYAYIHQAQILLEGGYSTYFPNGYPLFIILPLLLENIIPIDLFIVSVNVILSTAVIILILKAGELFFSRKFFILSAAMIVAIYPNQLNFVRYILTEVIAAFLLTLTFYLLLKNKIKLTAFAFGLLSIVKTSFLPVGFLFTGYLFLKEKNNWKKFLFFFLITPLSLILYGFIISGQFTLGNNLYHNLTLTATNMEGHYHGNLAAIEDYTNYFFNDPTNYFKDRASSLWELWGPLASKTDKMRGSLFYRILAGLRLPLLLLAIFSIKRMKKSKSVWFMIIALGIITFIHVILFASPRFTYPLEPILILFAVKGIELLLYKNKLEFI